MLPALLPLTTPAARAWLREHRAADPARLLLAAHRWPDLPVRELAAQLAARQKAADKLPTWAQDERLHFPPNLSVEQASSEATARFKAGLMAGAESLADLTGGFGVDALHCAATVGRVTYVEQQPTLAAVVAHNAQALGLLHVTLQTGSAEDWLATAAPDAVSWLYLDPARRDAAGRRVAGLADCTPDVLTLLPALLRAAPHVLLKTAPLLDITQATRQLGAAVQAVWVVETGGEVKEVLYELGRTLRPEPPPRRAVALSTDGLIIWQFTFTPTEEEAAPVAFGPPEAWLFEPAPTVLKAGALRLVAAHFGLRKLHPNTHLYTGPAAVPDFPGRQFQVSGTARYDRRDAHSLLPDGRASITARNFPNDDVPAIRKKLGLLDGGPHTLFACTGPDGKPLLVVGRRV